MNRIAQMLFPSFEYQRAYHSKLPSRSIGRLRHALQQLQGELISQDEDSFVVRLDAGKIARAMVPYRMNLEITVSKMGERQMLIRVRRISERTLYLGAFWVSVLVAVLSCFQRHSFEGLILPVLVLGMAWFHSFIPSHPAHLKIDSMARAATEGDEA